MRELQNFRTESYEERLMRVHLPCFLHLHQILARYAAEFTIFRELIQNADDAGATSCELRFESVAHCNERDASSSSNSDGSGHGSVAARVADNVRAPDFSATLRNWVFKNDGAAFNDQDWTRLKVSGRSAVGRECHCEG